MWDKYDIIIETFNYFSNILKQKFKILHSICRKYYRYKILAVVYLRLFRKVQIVLFKQANLNKQYIIIVKFISFLD